MDKQHYRISEDGEVAKIVLDQLAGNLGIGGAQLSKQVEGFLSYSQ